MTYRDFININTAAGTAKTSKEYILSLYPHGTTVALYPPNMNYPQVRNSIKFYELAQLMEQIRKKRIHICNPEVLAGYDFTNIPN